MAESSMIRLMARLAVGDVFRLPIDAHRVGFGQVVGQYKGGAYYFAVFERPFEVTRTPDLDEILCGSVALLALSLDALIHNGQWPIVGRSDPFTITWPVYRVSIAPDRFVAEDHRGRRVRRISEAEVQVLPFRKIVAPILVQRAFQALHGASECDPAYEALRYRGVR